MKIVKIIAILLLVYAGMVVAFEFMLGYFQPENQSTFIITIRNEDGLSKDRVLVRNNSGGQLYASANHWPRAWYYAALENPKVQVTIDGLTADYRAIPVSAEEHDRVDRDNPHGAGFVVLVGFAPRAFLRLDPV